MYIWLYWENKPGRVIPPYIELCHETIRHHCSGDFEVILTTPDNIRDYIPDAGPFEEIQNPNPAIRTAYIRVALLEKYGGIWMDSDIIVLKNFAPLKDLIQRVGFVGFDKISAGDNHVPNWMLMSLAGGKVITEYKRRIDEAVEKKKKFPWGQLGARMITPIIREWANPGDYAIIDERIVSPIPWQREKIFFTDADPRRYINDSTLSVMLFNNRFTDEFKEESREKVLNSNTMIAKLFKLSGGVNER